MGIREAPNRQTDGYIIAYIITYFIRFKVVTRACIVYSRSSYVLLKRDAGHYTCLATSLFSTYLKKRYNSVLVTPAEQNETKIG